ncbi:MAG: AMP-binding protein [Thermodesulfobacteriota bacterium]
MSSVPWNVGYIPYKHAQMHPEKTAVIFEDEPVSYRHLNEGINRCAHMLQSKGMKKGDRVSVLMLNCIEFLEIYFAVAKLGGILVPLNWRLLGPELAFQLNDCEARFLFFHDSFLGSIDLVRSSLKVEEDKLIYLKSGGPQFPGFELPGCPQWATAYPDLVADQRVTEPVVSEPVLMNDPLAIVYTSGVTGDPKGAVLSHEQTFFKNFQITAYTDTGQRDVIIAQMPLFHSGGLFIVATPSLNSGSTLVMRRGFDAGEFAEDIQTYRGTIVFALTTMWKMILESGRLDEIDVTSVRCVIGGGERTPPSLFEALAKRGLYMQQGFGQTENSAMMLVPRADIHRKMGSIGKPGYFTEIWIEDKTGKRMPPGEVGEIVATGPTVMSGYWNQPEATARTIVDGVLHTGDLGYMDEEGYFYIVDRAKDMYRSGGENVYPAEVEKILLNHPDISQVAIIGVPDERWGEVGNAFIVPKAPGNEIGIDDIRKYLKDKIAGYKHPVWVTMMSELPMTATMKIKKSELRIKYAAMAGLDAGNASDERRAAGSS